MYGRGNEGKDPREKVPPRPQGQRSEPTTNSPFSGFGFGGANGGGFHMSFGIGAFPFGFLATNLNFGEERPGAPPAGSAQQQEEQFLHKVFLWVSNSIVLVLIIRAPILKMLLRNNFHPQIKSCYLTNLRLLDGIKQFCHHHCTGSIV